MTAVTARDYIDPLRKASGVTPRGRVTSLRELPREPLAVIATRTTGDR
jgi:hypothetical protein